MVQRGQRSIVLIMGLSAGSVFVALLCSWQSLAVQYHLRKLRGDANYFLDVLERLGQGARQEALRQYLALPEGKDLLFQAFLKEVLGAQSRAGGPLRFSTGNLLQSIDPSSLALLWIGP